MESTVSVLLGKRSMPSPCPSLAWEPHSLAVGNSVGLCIPGVEPWCPSLPRLPCPYQLFSFLCCRTWHRDLHLAPIQWNKLFEIHRAPVSAEEESEAE